MRNKEIECVFVYELFFFFDINIFIYSVFFFNKKKLILKKKKLNLMLFLEK